MAQLWRRLSRAYSLTSHSNADELLKPGRGVDALEYFTKILQSRHGSPHKLKEGIDYYRDSIKDDVKQIVNRIYPKVANRLTPDERVKLLNSMLLNRCLSPTQLLQQVRHHEIQKLSISNQVTLLHMLLVLERVPAKILDYYFANSDVFLKSLSHDPHCLGVFIHTFLRVISLPETHEALFCEAIEGHMWSFIPKHITMILAYSSPSMQKRLCVSLYPAIEFYSRYELWLRTIKE
mmetsp:Transcript_21603/g.39503  ORF Transcript_21603/g.39503 Transcript_21603/m.39503 type:complete len:235 (+) Transcript_21603:1397-2101(+)